MKKHYLIELLNTYMKQNNLTQSQLALQLETHRGNIPKYLYNKLSITNTLLDRINIKPDKNRLRNEIITLIEKNNNTSNLISIYNKLMR